jgi:hypothetical protein
MQYCALNLSTKFCRHSAQIHNIFHTGLLALPGQTPVRRYPVAEARRRVDLVCRPQVHHHLRDRCCGARISGFGPCDVSLGVDADDRTGSQHGL